VSDTTRVPAVEGWFTTDREPHLIGSRCRECGTFHFPKETGFCRNPFCASTDLEEVPLSPRGTLWSFAINHYPPPPPSVAQPPYGVAAVELASEKMVILGQIAGSADGLKVGDAMELVVEPLDDEQLVWKWRKA
jgi:uncharacterized OB-fold protein